MVKRVIDRYDGNEEFAEITREIGGDVYMAEIWSNDFKLKFLETHNSIESAREAIERNMKEPYTRTIGG